MLSIKELSLLNILIIIVVIIITTTIIIIIIIIKQKIEDYLFIVTGIGILIYAIGQKEKGWISNQSYWHYHTQEEFLCKALAVFPPPRLFIF